MPCARSRLGACWSAGDILRWSPASGLGQCTLRVVHQATCVGRQAVRVARHAPGVAHRAVLFVVCCVACGFSKLAENFFKKVLDQNRRSVSIVDAPFTGN